MSAVLQLPVLHTQSPYMLKEKTVESFAPAFTAVNGRGSPPSPPQAVPTTHEMNARQQNQQPEHRPSDHGYRTASQSNSPTTSSGDSSPESPNKRKRSPSIGESHNSARSMDAPPHRSLPPIDHSREHEQRWISEPHQHNAYQGIRDARPMEPIHGSMPPMTAPHPHDPSGFESANSTEATRAGVQVDVKKRKRQFANRTKTGCGTCRRRKKKCDEAKPECNNCTRGGFVCEGYASKIPWPRNGAAKAPPPLQAKEQMAHEHPGAYPRCPVCNQVHLPHCNPARRESQPYPEHRAPDGAEGARARPIVVDEQERKPPAPGSWSNSWSETPRATYPEHPPPVPAQYPQVSVPNHERTPSHEQLMSQSQSQSHRQHTPRVYHHTPQSMSQAVNLPHAHANDNHHHPAQQPPRQSPMAPPTSAPPAPSQPHYAPPPRPHKTEKEKMLNGEPFLPYDEQLMDERAHCTGAVYGFNSTANASVVIARGDRERNFKRIVAAGWIHPRNMDRRPGGHMGGHVGGNVNVTTPFHCDYGYNISLAENVVIGPHCQLLDSARIAIGRNTKIGARVTITTLKTPTDTKSLKGSNGTELAAEVHIGENVYIGDGVIIEAGVKIGNNAIIRAGSVVVRDIARDVVAHGNPAFG